MIITTPPFGSATRTWGATHLPIEVSVPERIATSNPRIDLATADVARLLHGQMSALSEVCDDLNLNLVRLEAEASSAIEGYTADYLAISSAYAGRSSDRSASLIVANHNAILHLVRYGISEETVLAAHAILLDGDPLSGAYRDDIVWIGGSFSTPLTARYVPPAPEMIADLMEDFFDLIERDIHPVLLMAIAHAQFESIHPFHDGNGRIGRAIISAMMFREYGHVIPISAHLRGRRDAYYSALDAFRTGSATEITRMLCVGALSAAIQSARAVRRGDIIHAESSPMFRSDSTASSVLGSLRSFAVIDLASVTGVSGRSDTSALSAINSLVARDVLEETTGAARGRVWLWADLWEAYLEAGDQIERTRP